jgi:hypothetical protein
VLGPPISKNNYFMTIFLISYNNRNSQHLFSMILETRNVTSKIFVFYSHFINLLGRGGGGEYRSLLLKFGSSRLVQARIEADGSDALPIKPA